MHFKEFLENTTVQPLYFGCLKDVGHYVFDAQGHYVPSNSNPYAKWLASHDGQLAPQKNKQQGAMQIHRLPEFTVIAAWDYSVDKRPGSNAMFLIPGHHSDQKSVLLAKQAFPETWQRIFKS